MRKVDKKSDSNSEAAKKSVSNAQADKDSSVSKLKSLTLRKSCFIGTHDGNPGFDFLFSTCADKKLRLFFVDATIGDNVG